MWQQAFGVLVHFRVCYIQNSHKILQFFIEQDPMSHRIIEKRRRDRMNNCLAELSRLIPANYLKQVR